MCHDPKVDGITVAQATADQLLHLPLLGDVLQHYSQRAFLDIELKVPGLESKLLALLREFRMEEDYVVSSFLPEVVLELKARSAKIQCWDHLRQAGRTCRLARNQCRVRNSSSLAGYAQVG